MPVAYIDILRIGRLFFARHLDYRDNPNGTLDYYFIGWEGKGEYREIIKF